MNRGYPFAKVTTNSQHVENTSELLTLYNTKGLSSYTLKHAYSWVSPPAKESFSLI